jgi:UrcA family protein
MKAIRILLLALSVVMARAAFAADRNTATAYRVPVSYAGIDLTTHRGTVKLYRRIRNAAQSVCKDLYTLELGQRRYKWEACVQGATARAVLDINVPALTSYASARIGDLGKAAAMMAKN